MKEFEKIIGYEYEKKQLIRIAKALKNSEEYKKMGIKPPKGLLISGHPGVGKTLMANCLIKESGRKAFVCRRDKSDVNFTDYIKEVFEKAADNAPSIVFLDDMDKFANEDENHRNAAEYVTVQSCIDSIKNKDVFVVATANSTSNLPESLKRSGRFDKILSVEKPAFRNGVEIIKHYLSAVDTASELDAEYIGKLMQGCSCADIENIINQAAFIAGCDNQRKIQLSHFLEAALDIICRSSSVKIYNGNVDLNDRESYMTEVVFHEAGHVVVSELLTPKSVMLAVIEERGGTVSTYDEEEIPEFTYQQRRIISELAGIAATEYVFGKKDGGGYCDLRNALRRLRRLAGNGGMFGLNLLFSGWESDISEEIKTALKNHLEQYFIKAKEIITANREFLFEIAKLLADKKLIIYDDIQQAKEKCKITTVSI